MKSFIHRDLRLHYLLFLLLSFKHTQKKKKKYEPREHKIADND